MYIEYARKMRPGESTAPDGDPPSSAAVAGEPDAPATRCPPTGDAVSWANRQTSAGFQKRSSTARQPIETSAARMSVSSGPPKYETRNCTIAKETPGTSTAGRISRIRLQPASTTIREAGVRIENR